MNAASIVRDETERTWRNGFLSRWVNSGGRRGAERQSAAQHGAARRALGADSR